MNVMGHLPTNEVNLAVVHAQRSLIEVHRAEMHLATAVPSSKETRQRAESSLKLHIQKGR